MTTRNEAPNGNDLECWLHALPRLAAAVLQSGVATLCSGGTSLTERYLAIRWIFGDDDCPLPFCTACELVGLEPGAMRARVLRTGLIPTSMLPREVTSPDPAPGCSSRTVR